jgi:F-type H+-transporting ATPase subunit delta
MDNLEILHRKYARALIDLAKERNISQEIEEAFEKMITILKQNQSLSEVLLHPEISREEKFILIDKICKQDRFCDEFKDFLFTLLKANRFKLIHGIFLKYRELHDEAQGRLKVWVESAFGLDNQQKNRLVKTLESRLNRKIVLEASQTPGLIAGITIKAGSQIFDNSLNRNLELLRKRLKKYEN